MMSRNANRFGQGLADKMAAASRRLASDHIHFNIKQAMRAYSTVVQRLPQNNDPSSDGQPASPSAVLPVFFGPAPEPVYNALPAHPPLTAPHVPHWHFADAGRSACAFTTISNKGPAYVQ